jgi:flagellin
VPGGGAIAAAEQLNSAAQAFNDAAGKTGFTARVVKTDSGNFGLHIVNEEGKDLRINNTSATSVIFENTRAIDGSTTSVDTGPVTIAASTTKTTWADGEGSWITGQLVLDSESSFSLTDSNGASATSRFLVNDQVQGSILQKARDVDVSTVYAATRTLSITDSALTAINSQRARYGALQSRFESTIVNLQTTSENLSASRSRIRDADFAQETAQLTRNQILQQAGVAMLSQANALPNQVLQLLQR